MTPPGPSDRRAVLKEALQAIEDLQARLDASERNRREPIAIIGAGCRFPGGVHDLDSYWRLLRDGVDAVREVPRERWSLDDWYDPDPGVPGKTYTRWGGFLDHVDTFDAPFFGVSPREAASMDPQHRLLLEVAWEALENAGLAPSGLSGSQTGVFVGITTSEYMQLHAQRLDPTVIDAYLASGNTSNACAGRLSYILGLHGPSLAVDTACSSSLVAIHLACQSLRARESNLALAGGVNVILVPETYVCFSKWGMMAKDGRCKTFDAAADGFVRSEGSGVVVLKRLADALADGDDILAVIRGTACNQDGPSSGLSVPNGPAQQAVIRSAVLDAGIDPTEVAYVEAHGTGTSLGDPIEVEALGAVLGVGRSRDRPLLMGSAKTNLGHMESSSGVAGLIKVALALHRGEIPPHLHFKNPSQQIAWDQFPVAVPTQRTAWPAWASRRLAGASAFGFSGTNAHLILEQAPPREPKAVSGLERPRHLLALSGKGEPALRAAAGRLASFLTQNPGASLADVAYSTNVGRSHFAERMTLTASTADEARGKLEAFAEGRTEEGVRSGRVPSGRARVAFLFTGQGAQYAGMSHGLYETQPTFRSTLDRCAEILRPHLEEPLLAVLFPAEREASLLDQTAYTQPALFALEYALSEMWRSWGIEPTAVAGHSVGEYVAACVAGVFSLEDGLLLIAERARLMQALPAGGAMAAVLASEERVAPKLARFASTLSFAALNGPDNVVVSGRREDLDALLEELAAEGIKARRLTVSHAFHSPLMDPMLEAFERAAAGLTFKAPRLALVSNLTGRAAGNEVARPEYWRRHVREAVRFEAGVRTLHEKGYRTFLEIGPSPTLAAMAARCLPEGSATFLTSLRKGQDDWKPLLDSLAGLHLQGFEVDWRGFDRDYARTRVVLPSYPFQRERYWIKDSPRLKGAAAAEPARHPLLGHRVRSPLFAGSLFETPIATESLPFLGDHRVLGRVVFPATGYLEAASAAAEEVIGAHRLEDVQVQEALVVEEGETRTLQVAVATGDSGTTFKIWSAGQADAEPTSWRLHVQGVIRAVPEAASGGGSLGDIRVRCRDEISPSDFNDRLGRRGLDFGPRFRAITSLHRGEGEALGQVRLPEGLEGEQQGFRIHPGLLDSCLQVFVASWPEGLATSEDTYLPLSLESFSLRAPAPGPLWAHASLRPSGAAGDDVLTGDIRIFDEAGEPRGEIAGFVVKKASRSALERAVQERTQDWLYEVEWRPQPLVADEAAGFGPDPREAAAQVDLHAERLALEHQLPAYRAMLPGLEAASCDYVVEALRSLGWTPRVGEHTSASALAERLRVVPAHRRLLGRCLEMLAEEGVLERAGDVWTVRRLLEPRDPGAGVAKLLASAPASEAQIRLVERCGRELAAVLAGTQDPLQLLFPGGSLEALERLYTGSPFAGLYNGLVQQAVRAVIDALPPGRTLRILEIGAGTGGTTASVLPLLPADRTEYVFSDVSPLFTAKAAEKFREFPFVRYEVLDVEKDPAAQGFGGRRFDLVLAANVIHATRDLRSVLAHVRSLAVPNGSVMLLEGTKRQRWVDLTFGLTEGWWAFTDTDLRPDYALLSEEGWRDLMLTAGFEAVTAVPSEGRGEQDGQVLLLARAPKPVRTSTPEDEGAGRYLVLSDAGGVGRAVALGLRTLGEECVVAEAGPGWAATAEGFVLDPRVPAHFDRLLDEAFRGGPCRGVVHLWALDARIGEEAKDAELEEAEHSICAGVLGLAQALARRGGQGARGLWLVTRGAQPIGPSPLSVAQAPVWGLGKVLALEHPELHCVRVDLDPDVSANERAELLAEIGTDPREDQVAFRKGVRRVARLVPSTAPRAGSDEGAESAPVRLETATPGVLDSLVLRPAGRRPPGPQEVELRVSATGLNFRDVLNALGMYPGDAGPLGGECSGRVVAVGAGVTRFKAGDEVVGIAAGSFSTFVTTHEALLVPKPARLSFEDATTIPSAFMTAWYTLHRLAGIRSGERVLIHAAAGGVGMAAVQLARRAGALVFATAGSPAKREVLKELGVNAAFDSRSLSFADDILAHTGGEGVDVVLNSLSGDFIPRSLGLVRRGGRFLEIGKRGIWDAAQVAQLNPAITYHVVDLAAASAEDPALIGGILREVMAAVEAGELQPLPHQVFPLARAAEAFRHMAQAKHVGKVVIAQAPADRSSRSPSGGTVEPAVAFAGDGTFLITGGLAGLGLLTARFLVERGVRHLALVGRRAPSPEARAVIAEMEATGVRILVASTDISREEEIAALLRQIDASMPPLKGVVHSAGVLDDGAILQQDWPRFATVMGPKVRGGWALHRLTRDLPLDLFVLYSSASALLGSRGQSNHAAANAFLDALAHHRRAQGRPGVSINWGAWSEVGAAAERNVGERVKSRGIGTIGPTQGLACLERILSQGRPQVGVVPVDWAVFLGQAGAVPPFYADLAPKTAAPLAARKPAEDDIQARLAKAPVARRRALLVDFVRTRAVTVLGLSSSRPLDENQPLQELGLDSLMAVELRNLLGAGLGVKRALSATLLFDYPSLGAVADYLGREILGWASAAPPEEKPSQEAEAREELARLADEEAEALLMEELAALKKAKD